MQIFNVSEINYDFGEYENFEVEIHAKRLSNSSRLDFFVQKNTHNSFFILVKETDRSDELSRTELTTYEILIPSKKGSDFLANIRGPLYLPPQISLNLICF